MHKAGYSVERRRFRVHPILLYHRTSGDVSKQNTRSNHGLSTYFHCHLYTHHLAPELTMAIGDLFGCFLRGASCLDRSSYRTYLWSDAHGHISSQTLISTLGINVTESNLPCVGRNQNFTLFIKVHLNKFMLHTQKSDSDKNNTFKVETLLPKIFKATKWFIFIV